MSLRVRSAEALGLTLAVTSSAREKAAKRIARLRLAGPGAYLWTETEQEFGLYRERLPKPEDVCVECLKEGTKQTVSGAIEYVDGWGARSWVRTCPVHGKNPPVKTMWSVGVKERHLVEAVVRVVRVAKAARKGKPPVRESSWAGLERDMARVYGWLKGVA